MDEGGPTIIGISHRLRLEGHLEILNSYLEICNRLYSLVTLHRLQLLKYGSGHGRLGY